jgi:MoxR-like ATPase
MTQVQEKIADIRENVRHVIVGKDNVFDLLLTALLAGGHILLEDVPGTGKTMLAKTFAKSIDGEFKRIQFTADMLPSDITGITIYNQKTESFVFRKGPAFTNILLADEINRAMPRTQSALLECMEEKQITVDGDTKKLAEPFLVIATQNPVETAGTFPLPEAQLDRFMMKVSMGYPTEEEERKIVDRFFTESPLNQITQVCTIGDILQMRQEVRKVQVQDCLRQYLLFIARESRNLEEAAVGVSPRGTLALSDAARAYAYVCGRNFVIPEDIHYLAPYVLAHRIILHPGNYGAGVTQEMLVKRILEHVPVPTEKFEV